MYLEEHIYWEKDEPKFRGFWAWWKGIDYKVVLRPNSIPSKPIEGRDLYCIEIKQDLVEFSFEPDCLLVFVKDAKYLSPEEFKLVTREIASNITSMTGTGIKIYLD